MGMRERPRCVEFKNLMKSSCAFFGSTFEGVLGTACVRNRLSFQSTGGSGARRIVCAGFRR